MRSVLFVFKAFIVRKLAAKFIFFFFVVMLLAIGSSASAHLISISHFGKAFFSIFMGKFHLVQEIKIFTHRRQNGWVETHCQIVLALLLQIL